MLGITVPWKVQQLAKSVFGQDWVYNRATFRPDFSEASFARLPLGTMQPGQFKQQVVEQLLQRQGAAFLLPDDKVIPLADEIAVSHPEWRDSILDTASEICDKGLPIYHLRESPLTMGFPWKSMKNGPNSDQLFRSRPQRFGFAPVLAQAALFNHKYVSLLDEILQGWQQYARTSRFRWPYNSSHAVVYRVIALCFCWTFIGAMHRQDSRPESLSLLFRILNILRNDILFLGPCIGNAKPNNHLLADYFVGWLLYAMFPELIPDSMDFSDYEEKWQQELLRQFYPDGGSFEHAIHYHEHGCEMAIIYRLLAVERSIPCEVDQRIGAMLKFQAGLNGPSCRPWALGDTTEDTLLPLDSTLGWSSRAILEVHDFLYPEQSLSISETLPDQKTFWLLAGQGPVPQSVGGQKTGMEQYPDGGFVHWIDHRQKSELLFRTGVSPQSNFIPGHMHADVLSLFWRVNGIDLLAASGTYTYKFNRGSTDNYREYFCGPWSHSCVIIENEDPLGGMGGDFRRLDNGLRIVTQTFGACAIASLCIGEVESENCYHGFRRGVLHMPDDFTLVFDIFTKPQSEMNIGAGWHFGGDLDVRGIDKLELINDDVVIGALAYSAGGVLKLYRGEVSPIRGWQSDSYGLKDATNYAHIIYPRSTRIFAHLLTCAPESLSHSIISAIHNEEYVVVTVNYRNRESVLYLALRDSAYEFKIDDMVISARALVHQKGSDNASTLALIDCRSILGIEEEQVFGIPQTLRLHQETESERWKIES